MPEPIEIKSNAQRITREELIEEMGEEVYARICERVRGSLGTLSLMGFRNATLETVDARIDQINQLRDEFDHSAAMLAASEREARRKARKIFIS